MDDAVMNPQLFLLEQVPGTQPLSIFDFCLVLFLGILLNVLLVVGLSYCLEEDRKCYQAKIKSKIGR